MADRGGCATAFLWLLGLVVLIPGLCILYLVDSEITKTLAGYGPLLLWVAVGVVICVILYLIYDFSRGRGGSGTGGDS